MGTRPGYDCYHGVWPSSPTRFEPTDPFSRKAGRSYANKETCLEELVLPECRATGYCLLCTMENSLLFQGSVTLPQPVCDSPAPAVTILA